MESELSPVSQLSLSLPILVVDDEPSIRKALEEVLADEGFSCLFASNGSEALELLRHTKPALVLLDIWMPGLDGLETLESIQVIHPDLPVIMMSGHATIATAVQATKMGAREFIEKPLDLDATIEAICRIVSTDMVTHVDEASSEIVSQDELVIGGLKLGADTIKSKLRRVVFDKQPLRGRKVIQKTLANSAILYGQGLHSGKKSGLVLEPLPQGSGIHFVGVSETTVVPAHVDYVQSTGFATSLRLEGTQVATIEHLLSALHTYGISNLLIKCNGEVPVFDGSSLEFCNLIEEIGVEEQKGDWFAIKITETLKYGDEKEFIQIEPHDEFVVDYTLSYPEPLGVQSRTFFLGDVAGYKSEIAPARTFGFVKDIGYLQKQGLAQGGRFDNFVLYGEAGAINSELRFEDEAVRHKILDLIGDLYLLGRPIQGRVTASMTGHSDNISLLKLIQEQMRVAK